jgi:AcrR family transcriptional regulator
MEQHEQVTPGVRARRKEARPGELLSAALALFVDKGFAATRLDEVAARVGVSKGTLYLYFENKEALFKAVIAEGLLPILAEGEAILANQDRDPVTTLKAILFGWWERIGQTPLGGIPKLVMAEAHNFPEVAGFYHANFIVRGHTMVRAALERGVAAGVFRPVDCEMVVALAMAPLLHLANWRHSYGCCVGSSPEMSPERYLEAYFDLLMNGLGVASGARGEGT